MGSKSFQIARYTFQEIYKSRILLNVFFIGVALVVLTFVATEFTFGVPGRVALDIGLGLLSLSSLGISLFLGVTLLSKEIDSRTVYMIISRPVPRHTFILGKIMGLFGIQVLNVLILGTMTFGSVTLMGGTIDPLFYWCVFFVLIESLMLLLLVTFASLFTNTIIAALLSLILLILGHAVKETQSISFVQSSEVLSAVLEAYHFILPAFHKLNLKDFILYRQDLPLEFLLKSLFYGLSYSAALLCFIIFIFRRKNLD